MLLRSTLIYLPALLLPRVATFVLVIVATRLLPISEYGLFALVTTVGEIAEGVTTNWVRIALLRLSSLSTTFPGALWRATARVNRVTTALAVMLAAPAAFLLVPAGWPSFALAIAFYVAAMSLLRFGLHVLQSTQSRALYSLIETSRALAVLAVPILAVMWIHADYLVASLAISITTALFGIWALAAARRRVVESGPDYTPSDLVVFAAPIVTITAFGYAIASLERLVLQVLSGAAMVGGYSAAYALARQPFEVLGNAVNTGGFPHLVGCYERDGPAGARAAVARQLGLLLGLLLPGAALIAVLRVEIATAILPPAYHETAIAVLPWVAVGALCMALRTYVLDNVFYVMKRSWLQLGYFIPAAAATVVIAVLAVPRQGALGAAWAFAGGGALGLMLAAVAVARLMPFPSVAREIAAAAVSAAAVAVAANLGASCAVGGPPALALACGLAAAGAAFVASHAALDWRRTVKLTARLGAILHGTR